MKAYRARILFNNFDEMIFASIVPAEHYGHMDTPDNAGGFAKEAEFPDMLSALAWLTAWSNVGAEAL